jgi:hypothetical protein
MQRSLQGQVHPAQGKCTGQARQPLHCLADSEDASGEVHGEGKGKERTSDVLGPSFETCDGGHQQVALCVTCVNLRKPA